MNPEEFAPLGFIILQYIIPAFPIQNEHTFIKQKHMDLLPHSTDVNLQKCLLNKKGYIIIM